MNIEQQQRMYDALKRIRDDYMSPDEIRNHDTEAEADLDFEEYMEMSYENIQGEAAAAIRGLNRPAS